jgi:hypothetical protein
MRELAKKGNKAKFCTLTIMPTRRVGSGLDLVTLTGGRLLN